MISYFTYESRGSLTLFITAKAITKLNLGHGDKFEMSWIKFSRQLRTSSIHVLVLRQTAKKYNKNYNAHAQPLFSSLNILFSDMAVAIFVVVFLNSLLSGPVHTYPDIFESATFSFRIQKFPRPHVAYSNRIRHTHPMVSEFTLVPKAPLH